MSGVHKWSFLNVRWLAIGVHDREAVKRRCSGLNDGLTVGIRECPTITAADEQGVDREADALLFHVY